MNENLLHAPSTDLSTEVIKFFIGPVLAQATEAFLEKTTDENKAAQDPQDTVVYTSLNEQGKVLFLPSPIPLQPSRQLSVQAWRRPRPIPTLLHLLLYLLCVQPPSNLPLTLGHPCSKKPEPIMCMDRKNEGQRENDMIYNAVVEQRCWR